MSEPYKLRERKIIGKCPDKCERDEYDLGTYRGFHLFQKPFYDGWQIYAQIIDPDELDKMLLSHNTWPDRIFDDTERSGKPSLENVEKGIIEGVNEHWVNKARIIKAAKEGKYLVAI